MNAYELIERVKSEFEKSGFRFEQQGSDYYTPCEMESGARYIYAEPTWRHNGTEQNVTVTVRVLEVDKLYSRHSASLKTLLKVKVPKDASDKIIANRVAKAIEAFNQ